MTGLILKDLLCLRKMMSVYAVFLAGFLALCVAIDFPVSSIATFLSIVIMVLPMTEFSYDKQAKWDIYGLALPVSRTKTVAARYLLFLLIMGGVAVIAAAFLAVLILMDRQDSAWDLLLTFCGCMGAGVLFNAILLPLTYRFGIERAKIIAFGLIIVIAGLVTLWMVGLGGLDRLQSPDSIIGGADGPTVVISTVPPLLAAVDLTLVCAVLLGVSFLISCAIFKKKEM